MTPQDLKNSILQLAIQGKLVEQRPEEGSAEDLYRQIQAEKLRLVKAGKIKKEKPLPEITEDEIPFEIPESWKWVRLSSACLDLFSGKAPVYSKIETDYRIIGQAANQQSGLDYTQLKYTNADFWNSMDSRYFLREHDVLLNTLGNGTLGRSGYLGKMRFPLLTDGHLFVFRTLAPVSSKYLYYYLQYTRTEIEKDADGSTNQTFLTLTKTAKWLFPLPPLPEQRRIVAKIEELQPLIDRYAEAWTQLEAFNKRFPEDMQKSLLQLAIQGKLVEQRPEEGTGEELYRKILATKNTKKTKKEKPLPPITEDEIPFDIPESWKWVRLANIWSVINGDRGKNYPSKSTLSHTGIPFISALNLDGKTVVNDDNLLCLSDVQYEKLGNGKLEQGDVVVCIRGSLGKHGRYPFEKGAIASSLVIMRSRLGLPVLDDFLMLYLDTPLFFSEIKRYDNGTAQPNLAAKSLEQFLFPLPPLAEQKRIITRLEEILLLCKRLCG